MEYNDDYNYQGDNIYDDSEKHPTGLTVLCILTFIGSGFSIITYLVSFFMYDILPEMMLTMGESLGGTLGETYENAADMFANIPQYSFLVMTIPYLLSIVGSGFMLKMHKLGFHLYVTSQILILGLPMLISKGGFNTSGLFISLLFISLYAIYLKRMK